MKTVFLLVHSAFVTSWVNVRLDYTKPSCNWVYVMKKPAISTLCGAKLLM